jgi:hypothetical protein
VSFCPGGAALPCLLVRLEPKRTEPLYSFLFKCLQILLCVGACGLQHLEGCVCCISLLESRKQHRTQFRASDNFVSFAHVALLLSMQMPLQQMRLQSSNDTSCGDFTTCTRCVGQWMVDTEIGSKCLWCSSPKANSNGELTVVGCIERTGAAEVCPYGRLQATCGTAYSSYVFILAMACTLCCCCGLLMLRRFLASWAGQREWRGSSRGSLDLLRPLLDDDEEDTYEGVFGASFR